MLEISSAEAMECQNKQVKSYPLVNQQFAIEHGPVEIVIFSIKMEI